MRMPYKDKEKFKKMHRIYNRTWKKRRSEARRKILDKIIGSECFICSATNCLTIHKKDGKPHTPINDMTIKEFGALCVNPEEFVRLCRGCHQYTHWNMRWLSISWNELEARLK